MEKVFLVHNVKEKREISLSKNITVGEIKKLFNDYNIKMFVNKKTEIPVFDTNKYDKVNLESVWDDIDNPYIILSHKYFTTKEKLKETIHKFGVAIIPNVLTFNEIEEIKNGMWDYLETISGKFEIPIKRTQKETWKGIYNLMPLHSMLIQHWGIGHTQFIWDLRQKEVIVDIYSYLWNVSKEDLLVSFDGASFHMPPEETNRGYYRGNDWFHTDQKLSDSKFKCLQSWVTAFDVNEGDATLTFLEGSNNFHEEFAKKYNKLAVKDDWYKLEDEEIKFFLQKGCHIKNITCPAGSFVLWDSRTFHAGKESIKGRKNSNFRCVVYLCYAPRSWSTEALLKKKRKAFQEKRTCSHWPEKSKLFPKNPRTYGKALPIVSEIPSPVLNTLGMKLAGF